MNAPSSSSAPSVNPLPTGTRLQDFEVREVLGVGGFGIVYRAFDHALERDVALKEYMPSALADRTATLHVSLRSSSNADTFALGLRSFVNEARLLARFDHPSLVKVYRFWEANGTAYMAMQLYRGRTLKEMVGDGAGPKDEAALRKILLPLLGALERLHDDGVFHRDISPDNIVIEPDGHPVLLDFGAARHVIADRSQNLTAILKPSYAPIEQYAEAGGVKQGPWTDFYALGATLHFVMLGKAPPPATARAIEDGMVPMAQQNFAGYSPGFLQIVDWMLAPRPNDRPRSVANLRDVLAGRNPVPPPGLGTTNLTTRPLDDDATVVLAPRTDLLDATVVVPPPTSSRPPATLPPMPTATQRPYPEPTPAPVPPPRVPAQPATITQKIPPPSSSDAGKTASKRSGLTLMAMIGGYSAVAGAALWWFFFMRGGPAPAPASVAVAPPPAVAVPAPPPPAPAPMPAPVAASEPLPSSTPPATTTAPAPAPVPVPTPAPPPVATPPVATPRPPTATDAATRDPAVPRRATPAPPPRPLPSTTPPVVVDTGVPPPSAYPPSAYPPPPRPAPPSAPRATPTPVPAPAPAPAVTQSPREACGSRVLVALWNCMDRECARPEFVRHGECVKWREMRERQRNAESP